MENEWIWKVESGVNNNVNTNTTVISGGINAQQTGNAETVQESNGQSLDAIASYRTQIVN